MKIRGRHRRTMHVIRTLARSVRAQLDAHHQALGVEADLGGACAFGTVLFGRTFELYLRARDRTDPFVSRPVVVFGWFQCSPRTFVQHCWAEVMDVIVDVTATQFGAFPRARICPRTNARYAMMIASGRDALQQVQHFPLSPRRRRRRLELMSRAAFVAAAKELRL